MGVGLPPAPARAQEAPAALVIEAINLTASAEGRAQESDRDSAPSRPGDVIEYQLLFTNTGTSEVRDVVLDDPIPAGLVYLGGSAGSDWTDVRIEFSIDDGVTYSTSPEIEVEVAGVVERRPAPPEHYTHIRWTMLGTVASGSQVRAHFQAQIAPRNNDAVGRRYP